MSDALRLLVAHTWDGQPLAPAEQASLRLSAEGDSLLIEVSAPFYGDPAPGSPPGPCWALWEHEVVELFVLGPEDRYTEVELGPHGHHLVLQLAGRRTITASKLPLDWTARVEGARWTGRARLDRALLPLGPHRINAYAIHGQGDARRYLAAAPVPGPAPDFHRLERFPAMDLPGA